MPVVWSPETVGRRLVGVVWRCEGSNPGPPLLGTKQGVGVARLYMTHACRAHMFVRTLRADMQHFQIGRPLRGAQRCERARVGATVARRVRISPQCPIPPCPLVGVRWCEAPQTNRGCPSVGVSAAAGRCRPLVQVRLPHVGVRGSGHKTPTSTRNGSLVVSHAALTWRICSSTCLRGSCAHARLGKRVHSVASTSFGAGRHQLVGVVLFWRVVETTQTSVQREECLSLARSPSLSLVDRGGQATALHFFRCPTAAACGCWAQLGRVEAGREMPILTAASRPPSAHQQHMHVHALTAR